MANEPKTSKPKTGSSKTWQTKNPQKKAQPVGTGQFPVPPSAEARLEKREHTEFASGPIPTPAQISQQSGFDSVVTPQRLFYFKLTQFSPIRLLTPELLAQYLDLFEQGYIRWLTLLQWRIAQRDPILATVIPKRYGSVKRLKWQILIEEDLEPGLQKEAEAHKEALFKFYQNLRCSSAVDLNLNAGVSSLFEQMMTSVAYKWAVHEIIWNPMADGNLTARFNFIPLWFFENRSGKLRFTETDFQLDGRDLKDGSFLITTGPGIMEPCSVSYLYKSLAQKWWLAYIEGHAAPLKVGTTNASRNSTNWKAMERALQQAVDSILLAKDETLTKVDTAATGELPYQPMVEEMNRMMATLWRGADLSTMSAKASNAGQGALLQGKEEYFLQCDDASRITETMNFQVDPQVIGWHFGEGVRPLAYFKLVVPPNIEASTDISVVNALIAWGLSEKLGKKQILEHFGWSEKSQADDSIEPVQAATATAGIDNPSKDYENALAAANELYGNDEARLLAVANDEMAKETSEALAPLREGVRRIVEAANENRTEAYRAFRRALPTMLQEINRDPANAEPLRRVVTSSWFLGLASAAKRRKVAR